VVPHPSVRAASRRRLVVGQIDPLPAVWIILGAMVTALLGQEFAALPGNHLGTPKPGFVLFNIVLDLVEGISILWLYAAIRPRYGSGANTAIIAAIAWWFIVSLGDAAWCSFGLFPPRTVADHWAPAGPHPRRHRQG
jgi:hypothetical protein